MPEYQTDGPIDLAIDVPVGRIEVTASERTDVDVRVDPSDPAKKRMCGPPPKRWSSTRTAGSPSRRRIGTARSAAASRWTSPWICRAAPGSLRTPASAGSARTDRSAQRGSSRPPATSNIERVAMLQVHASSGEVVVGHVDGDLELTSGNGSSRVEYVGGAAGLKASNGDIHIGVAGGPLTAKLANGSINVHEALGSVSARNSYGKIRLDEVSAGAIQLDASYGEVLVGIRRGVAAWLDIQSKNGVVRNDMNADEGPVGSEGTVEIRVRTNYGDITIQPAIMR